MRLLAEMARDSASKRVQQYGLAVLYDALGKILVFQIGREVSQDFRGFFRHARPRFLAPATWSRRDASQ